MESITEGRWMEAKSLKLRRNRKKEIFDIPLLTRQDFPKKSVLTEKVGEISFLFFPADELRLHSIRDELTELKTRPTDALPNQPLLTLQLGRGELD